MKQTERPMWKKSMLANLNLDAVRSDLYDMADNGDMYGYSGGDEGYYQEYKEFFDELSCGAYHLLEAMEGDLYAEDNWDIISVGLLGYQQEVWGYDSAEADYHHMLSPFMEDWAVEEAVARLKRLTKDDLIDQFRQVMVALLSYFDIKASHDCLTSIVQELDERGAIFARKNDEINRLYEDLTGKNGDAFDALIENLPPRMWVE